MARPAIIRDETIIEAARDVFLERGFRATTAEVAERAGVSEGSIFKRFRSKVELFEAAMGSPEEEPPFLEEWSRLPGQHDVVENLLVMGRDLEAHLRNTIPMVMMAWSNPGAGGALPCGLSGPNPTPLRILAALTTYFEREIRLGRVRSHEPEILARTFLGSIHNFVFFEVLFKSNADQRPAVETHLRGLIQLLRTGIEPEQESGTTAAQRNHT
jgi:AcrR family transcriptional regulator